MRGLDGNFSHICSLCIAAYSRHHLECLHHHPEVRVYRQVQQLHKDVAISDTAAVNAAGVHDKVVHRNSTFVPQRLFAIRQL